VVQVNRRLTDRGRERRRQLMEFATRSFAQSGYHPTSVAEIVTGLGVGKGVFYWYFESKEELFLEILRDGMTDLRRSQQQLIAGVDDPIERIRLGIRATARWSAAHRDLYRLTQFAATQQEFAPTLRKGRETAVEDTNRHVREGIARGLLRDIDPDYISHAILGVATHLVGTFIHGRGADPEEVADIAAAFVLDGILTGDQRAADPPPKLPTWLSSAS
jgi:AcrR family transcriptional regulator